MDIVGEKRKLENDSEIAESFNEKKSKLETSESEIKESQPSAQEIDPLKYTKAEGEEFTSEIFKVQIHNLPNYFGFAQFKKRLKSSLGLNPHKIKAPQGYKVVYVCFSNEEERQEAVKKINGHKWKGKTLEAKIAAAAVDPYFKKHAKEKKVENSHQRDEPIDNLNLTPEEAEERLKKSVIPLWNVDYQDQLKIKTENMRNALIKVAKSDMMKTVFKPGKSAESRSDAPACELDPIVPSPVVSEYRNKNEFTIGYGLDGKTITIGFRYGLYKDGTTAVGDCTKLKIAMPAALPVVESFSSFLRGHTSLAPFQQAAQTGHWHTLTVRTFQSGHVLAMVDFVPRQLSQDDMDKAKSDVKNFYESGEGSNVKITSFYFRFIGAQGHGGPKKTEYVFGEKNVYEELCGLRFQVSPDAFFQVNSFATEKLYEMIGDWSGVSENTTLLDICCGTGTIGLSLAKKVKSVIGIEMCKEAVDDARNNAKLNDITNIDFHCAKVEDVVSNILSRLPSYDDVVAIVDPPRAGLHKSVIKAIRKTEEIERLVFVSCNAKLAVENFVDLMRPASGKHRGTAFSLKRAVPVDLFPGTPHCELLLLFERSTKASKNDTHTLTENIISTNNTQGYLSECLDETS